MRVGPSESAHGTISAQKGSHSPFGWAYLFDDVVGLEVLGCDMEGGECILA